LRPARARTWSSSISPRRHRRLRSTTVSGSAHRRRCPLCPEPSQLWGDNQRLSPWFLSSSFSTPARLFEPSTYSCLPKSPPVHARYSSRPRALFSPWDSLVLKSIRFLSLTVFTTLAWSAPVLAQSAPPPAGSDSDDLEVPSNPTVPGAAAPKPLPESKPESKPAAPKANGSTEELSLQRELVELRGRLDALEHARATAPVTQRAETPRVIPNADTSGSSYL